MEAFSAEIVRLSPLSLAFRGEILEFKDGEQTDDAHDLLLIKTALERGQDLESLRLANPPLSNFQDRLDYITKTTEKDILSALRVWAGEAAGGKPDEGGTAHDSATRAGALADANLDEADEVKEQPQQQNDKPAPAKQRTPAAASLKRGSPAVEQQAEQHQQAVAGQEDGEPAEAGMQQELRRSKRRRQDGSPTAAEADLLGMLASPRIGVAADALLLCSASKVLQQQNREKQVSPGSPAKNSGAAGNPLSAEPYHGILWRRREAGWEFRLPVAVDGSGALAVNGTSLKGAWRVQLFKVKAQAAAARDLALLFRELQYGHSGDPAEITDGEAYNFSSERYTADAALVQDLRELESKEEAATYIRSLRDDGVLAQLLAAGSHAGAAQSAGGSEGVADGAGEREEQDEEGEGQPRRASVAAAAGRASDSADELNSAEQADKAEPDDAADAEFYAAALAALPTKASKAKAKGSPRRRHNRQPDAQAQPAAAAAPGAGEPAAKKQRQGGKSVKVEQELKHGSKQKQKLEQKQQGKKGRTPKGGHIAQAQDGAAASAAEEVAGTASEAQNDTAAAAAEAAAAGGGEAAAPAGPEELVGATITVRWAGKLAGRPPKARVTGFDPGTGLHSLEYVKTGRQEQRDLSQATYAVVKPRGRRPKASAAAAPASAPAKAAQAAPAAAVPQPAAEQDGRDAGTVVAAAATAAARAKPAPAQAGQAEAAAHRQQQQGQGREEEHPSKDAVEQVLRVQLQEAAASEAGFQAGLTASSVSAYLSVLRSTGGGSARLSAAQRAEQCRLLGAMLRWGQLAGARELMAAAVRLAQEQQGDAA